MIHAFQSCKDRVAFLDDIIDVYRQVPLAPKPSPKGAFMRHNIAAEPERPFMVEMSHKPNQEQLAN